MPDFDAIALLDALPDAVLAVDPAGAIAFVNARLERVLSWNRDELIGRPLSDVLPRSDGARVLARRKDGAQLGVELVESSSGSLRVLVLRQVHEDPEVPPYERYRLVFEHAPMGLLHWDKRGLCTGCNDEMLRLLGSTRTLVIGLDLLNLRGDPSRERISEIIRGTLHGKTARYDGPYTSQTAN
jgi:PAS domain-containing protein